MMPPVIINYNGLPDVQKHMIDHVQMPVIIAVLAGFPWAVNREPPPFGVGSLFDAVRSLNVEQPKPCVDHFVRSKSTDRGGCTLAAYSTRTNKLPILSGVFTESYTVLAIIVFYHCFSLSPRNA